MPRKLPNARVELPTGDVRSFEVRETGAGTAMLVVWDHDGDTRLPLVCATLRPADRAALARALLRGM